MSTWTGAKLSDLTGHESDARHDVSDKAEIRKMLISCAKANASDIIFQTGQPVLANVYGDMFSVSRRWLQEDDLRRVAIALSAQDSVMPRLLSGVAFDSSISYDDPDERAEDGAAISYRFRVSITGCQYEGGEGFQVVLRYIRSIPPTPDEIDLESELLAECAPSQGAVIIAGETGSGKTTTMAAFKRHILAGHTEIRGNLLTFEAPIEFLFDRVESSCCTIAQHEVPQHIKTFEDAVRNAMRRNPSLIEIQELRDETTIMAACEAADTGHTVYATTHASSVSHIFRRLTQRFPVDQQSVGFYGLVSSVHLLVSQVLVPKIGGGRLCLREWQVLTEDIKQVLEKCGPEGAYDTMRQIIRRDEHGQCMLTTVQGHLEAGRISAQTAIWALNRYGYRKEATGLLSAVAGPAGVSALS